MSIKMAKKGRIIELYLVCSLLPEIYPGANLWGPSLRAVPRQADRVHRAQINLDSIYNIYEHDVQG